MAEIRAVNSIVGLDTAATPDQSLSYLMAFNSDTKAINDEMNFSDVGSAQGFAHQTNRRRGHPQAATRFMNSIVGLDTAPAPDQSVGYMMAVVDDPISSGGKFVIPDRRNKGKSNYPPQIGA